MGSPLRLTLGGDGGPDRERDAERADAAWAAVLETFARTDQALSRFLASSDLTRLNQAAGTGEPVAVGRCLQQALVAADRARRVTGGRFDPRVLETLEAIGEHGADLGRTPTATSPLPQAEPILRRTSEGIAIDRPIDLGGIGKGLALRWAGHAVEAGGETDFLLDAGGDIVVRGAALGGGPWLVGIEDPGGSDEPVAVIAPGASAVATSSIRRRAWIHGGRAVHHLIDPRTGDSAASGLGAVTVLGADPAWAEVWSKALFMGGRDTIATEARGLGMAAWWITSDGELGMTPAARSVTAWVAAEDGLVRSR